MTDPNIVISGLSGPTVQSDVQLQIDIYRLETESEWTLEVIHLDGVSTVWGEKFDSDQSALEEAQQTIRSEGTALFTEGGNVIQFPDPSMLFYYSHPRLQSDPTPTHIR